MKPKISKKRSNNKYALVVLHEIYGINKFILEICNDYKIQGFDVFCPDMIQGKSFLYSEVAEAYQNFLNNTGFGYYKKIEELILKLKLTYEKVFIIGFSVGATIAWRCCEYSNCDGIICCYGSRIRDYMSFKPSKKVLLLFAKNDSFDVENIAEKLSEKQNIEIYVLQASHGFMDHYSDYFNKEQTQIAKMYIEQFLNR